VGLFVKKNPLWSAFLIGIVLVGLLAAGAVRFGTVYASTEIVGVIASDTTWTKTDSPYTLTGPVKVNPGVTLTVEPGTTVNLNDYYLQVEGTLYARGNDAENINFTGGSNTPPSYAITFTSSSSDWNEKTGTGCIIENAVLNSILINDSSPMIRNNNISAFYALDVNEGAAQIVNNSIKGQIGIHAGTPVIRNNAILGEINVAWAAPLISSNTIEGSEQETGIAIAGNSSVTGNIIYGCKIGVYAVYGNSTIEKNLIINNVNGIVVGDPDREYVNLYGWTILFDENFRTTILNNAIANNSIGINLTYYLPNRHYSALNVNATPTILHNNIQDNTNYSIYLGSQLGLNATDNWWGTTDPQIINQTIYDNKRDFNLATVVFTPFLTAPDPEASAIAATPPPQRNPSPPEPKQDNPQVDIREIVIAILIVTIVVLSIIVLRTQKRNQTQKNAG